MLSRARTALALGAVLLFAACVHKHYYPVADAEAATGSDVYFYEELSPYGEWLYVENLGWCWRPYRDVVGPAFVPYSTGGQWIYTPYGWVFDSDYYWGNIAFHYGRWGYFAYAGWLWVPDYYWGPAWVDWRYGGGYVGWAPSPPRQFEAIGMYDLAWSFVPEGEFPAGRHHPHVLPPERVPEVVEVTRPVPPIVADGEVWHRGPPLEPIARVAEIDPVPQPIERPSSPPPGRSIPAPSFSDEVTPIPPSEARPVPDEITPLPREPIPVPERDLEPAPQEVPPAPDLEPPERAPRALPPVERPPIDEPLRPAIPPREVPDVPVAPPVERTPEPSSPPPAREPIRTAPPPAAREPVRTAPPPAATPPPAAAPSPAPAPAPSASTPPRSEPPARAEPPPRMPPRSGGELTPRSGPAPERIAPQRIAPK